MAMWTWSFGTTSERKEVIQMPRFDGTGPMGMGPRTGGGFGYCSPGAGPEYGPGYYPRGAGRGFAPRGGGRGRAWGGGRARGGWGGSGRGVHRWEYASSSPEAEVSYLRDQASALEEQLQAIQDRIDELSAEKGEEK